jgi:hypothetical protein
MTVFACAGILKLNARNSINHKLFYGCSCAIQKIIQTIEDVKPVK